MVWKGLQWMDHPDDKKNGFYCGYNDFLRKTKCSKEDKEGIVRQVEIAKNAILKMQTTKTNKNRFEFCGYKSKNEFAKKNNISKDILKHILLFINEKGIEVTKENILNLYKTKEYYSNNNKINTNKNQEKQTTERFEVLIEQLQKENTKNKNRIAEINNYYDNNIGQIQKDIDYIKSQIKILEKKIDFSAFDLETLRNCDCEDKQKTKILTFILFITSLVIFTIVMLINIPHNIIDLVLNLFR